MSQIEIGNKLQNKNDEVVQVLLKTDDEILVRFDKKREGGSHEVLKLPVYQDWKTANLQEPGALAKVHDMKTSL